MTPPVNPYVNVYRQPGYKHRVNDDGRSNELVGRSGQEAIDEALYRHLEDADDVQYDGRPQPTADLFPHYLRFADSLIRRPASPHGAHQGIHGHDHRDG